MAQAGIHGAGTKGGSKAANTGRVRVRRAVGQGNEAEAAGSCTVNEGVASVSA